MCNVPTLSKYLPSQGSLEVLFSIVLRTSAKLILMNSLLIGPPHNVSAAESGFCCWAELKMRKNISPVKPPQRQLNIIRHNSSIKAPQWYNWILGCVIHQWKHLNNRDKSPQHPEVVTITLPIIATQVQVLNALPGGEVEKHAEIVSFWEACWNSFILRSMLR